MKIDWEKAIGLTAAAAMLLPSPHVVAPTMPATQSPAALRCDPERVGPAGGPGRRQRLLAEPGRSQLREGAPRVQDHLEERRALRGRRCTQVQTDPTAAADVYMFASDQLAL